ncbi:MAG: hypothetical protein HY749_14465 [Gammaproteobacteria bacterium]|nr:hypothetical protein [Gammaproteobacteria bacterium]MBI5615129.1 hypothetical protein [Gammaproteobacteria bacterium]
MSAATWGALAIAACALWLGGCAELRPGAPRPAIAPDEDAEYARLFPYYAESCAVSQLKKKEGFGAELFGGIGGHQVFYLNGVCRARDEKHPRLVPCDELPAPHADGVGFSVNEHYRNATWAAVEGRDFFFAGGLPPDGGLTREAYARVQRAARAQGIYAAIDFHERYFTDMQPGFTRDEFRYELSIATDYAIALGRNRYCARVPLRRGEMRKVVDFLNALNAPYAAGDKEFAWNVLTHNCAHVNHNALAAVDLWPAWPMDRPLVISALDFPVPKNEFVNLLRRTNDLPIEDLEAMYADSTARAMLLREGRLPTGPGAIADLGGILRPNEVYDDESRSIFYDLTPTRSFQRRFDEILSEPRYLRLRDNLAYFAARYRHILAARQPLAQYLARRQGASTSELDEFREFYRRYYEYIEKEVSEVASMMAVLQYTEPDAAAAGTP